MNTIFCTSAVHCGCRNLLDATSTTNTLVLAAKLRVVEAERDALVALRDAESMKVIRRNERIAQLEAERDALARSLDASASTVALLSAHVGRAETERDEARDQRDGSFEDVTSLNGCLERATARADKAEAERDAAYKTISRLNRRAQEAERIALHAMRVGLDVAHGMRAIADHWRRAARERFRASLTHRSK